MNLLIYVKLNMIEHCTRYKLSIIKNHMTLPLSIVETVKCQIFTIRGISMHFGYLAIMAIMVTDVRKFCTSFTHLS